MHNSPFYYMYVEVFWDFNLFFLFVIMFFRRKFTCRACIGGGWLSSEMSETNPLDALGVFTLSPDKKKTEKESDADDIRKSKEAVGMVN